MRWLRRRSATPEADKELADAQAEYAQVAELDEQTRRIERHMRSHIQQNNFAARLRKEILATQRGKHA